jgi:hypothetical protein
MADMKTTAVLAAIRHHPLMVFPDMRADGSLGCRVIGEPDLAFACLSPLVALGCQLTHPF